MNLMLNFLEKKFTFFATAKFVRQSRKGLFTSIQTAINYETFASKK